MKIITIVTITLSFCLLFSCKPKKKENSENIVQEDTNVVVEDSLINNNEIVENDSIENDNNLVVENDSIEMVNEEVVENSPDTVRMEVVEKAPKPKEKKYYVIVGSFKNSDNALKLKSKIEKAGTKAEILYGKDNFKRVCITYKNYGIAIKEQKKLKAIYSKLDVWLMDNKNL